MTCQSFRADAGVQSVSSDPNLKQLTVSLIYTHLRARHTAERSTFSSKPASSSILKTRPALLNIPSFTTPRLKLCWHYEQQTGRESVPKTATSAGTSVPTPRLDKSVVFGSEAIQAHTALESGASIGGQSGAGRYVNSDGCNTMKVSLVT